jgi:hypothetical protein
MALPASIITRRGLCSGRIWKGGTDVERAVFEISSNASVSSGGGNSVASVRAVHRCKGDCRVVASEGKSGRVWMLQRAEKLSFSQAGGP